jgi:hypothetical protein
METNKIEINTWQFIVQRSPDGNSFAAIGSVAAKNASGQILYGFTESHPYAARIGLWACLVLLS